MVKIAALETTDIVVTPTELRLSLGTEPASVPPPFDHLLKQHLADRPNLRTTAGSTSAWLFPGYRIGSHLSPTSMMNRIRDLGIDILGARVASLRALVAQVPPPLVAELLGYSQSVAHKHAALAAQPWSRYARRGSPDEN
ncbi:hypothetical protein [Nocardia farcinica]|uniref:hypothetical protein n=1 Tax=Nocardia farcinica TaxID=37329 RepID=UPI002455EA54|nr:hypothetical protein [Nocardia farcinica]